MSAGRGTRPHPCARVGIRRAICIAAVVGAALGVSACASIGAGTAVDAAYSAAMREPISDAHALPAELLARVRSVKVLASREGLEGEDRGTVTGLSCKLTAGVFVFRWVWKPALDDVNGQTPEDAAWTQLRIRAVERGADTLVAPRCTHRDGIDWGQNCFESWRCTAQAFATR